MHAGAVRGRGVLEDCHIRVVRFVAEPVPRARDVLDAAEGTPGFFWRPGRSVHVERGQTLQGSLSAVSKSKFASKYSLESSRRDITMHSFAPFWNP